MELGWINGINLTAVILPIVTNVAASLLFGACHLMIVQENQS